MASPILLASDGEAVCATIDPGYAGTYSDYVRFLRQHLPGVWIDWVAAREAYRFGRGRGFPIGWRSPEAALDERAKIRFSADGLQAFLTLYPPKGRGRRLTEPELARLVRGYGLPPHLLDGQAIRTAFLRRAYQDPEPIAAGRPPVDGAPARVEWKAGLPSDPASFLAALGERGWAYPDEVLAEVAEGEAAGTLVPPGPGTPGIAAWGDPLPARGGQNPLRIGPSLAPRDGGTILRALRAGHLRLSGPGGTEASVLPLLTVRDGQELEPWRGRVFPGSLLVLGDLEARFPLRVLGDAEVRGGLVRSSLEVMGSLFVRDGVIHRGYEPVRVGGILSAGFFDRAWVAAHTVHVRRYSLQSRLLALDAVVAPSPEANLCGGQIAARQRVEVDTLGSPNSMETEVAVGSTAFTGPFQTTFQGWAEALRAPPPEGEASDPALLEAAARWEKAALDLGPPDLGAVRIAARKVHAGVSVRVASAVREIGSPVGPVSFGYERIGDRDRVAMTRG